ncbi:hypothetical protein BG000_002021 [Podila horticola]|nr:hypothetical protein BG000_002021 [Podila horticola]
MDPLSEFRQVEQYIARFDKALRDCVPYASYMERAQDQGQGNEPERGQETQAQIEATPPVMEDFDESMLRLKLEQETERAMEVARLAPRLKSQ